MDTTSLLSARNGPEGVRASLHSAALRGAVRSALAGMLDDPAALGPCRLHRTKFKPPTKLTAWFTVGLRDGPGRRAVAVSWGGREPPCGEDAEADARSRGCAFPFRALTAHVPALQMRVDVAPLDPAFPGLVPMSDPDHVASCMGVRTRPEIVTLRYRPGQRHVLRYQPTSRGDGPALFAKLYRDDRGAGHARTTEAVADILDDAGGDGVAARPTAYLPAEQALLFAQVAGAPLSSLLRTPGEATASALRQAGRILRRVHEADPAPLGALAHRSVTDEIHEVARAAAAIGSLSPTTGVLVDDVLARTRGVLTALPEEAAGLCHGDFKSDHLLVGRTSLTLIDFDKCVIGDAALDLAKLLADLRWWLAGNPDAATAAQGQFLEGYGSAPTARAARARALEPLFMVKLAARRVQVHQPHWARRTHALVEHADHLLQGLSRA